MQQLFCKHTPFPYPPGSSHTLLCLYRFPFPLTRFESACTVVHNPPSACVDQNSGRAPASAQPSGQRIQVPDICADKATKPPADFSSSDRKRLTAWQLLLAGTAAGGGRNHLIINGSSFCSSRLTGQTLTVQQQRDTPPTRWKKLKLQNYKSKLQEESKHAHQNV